MKKKTLALFGAVAFAGVALASCGKKNDNNSGDNNANDNGRVADAYYTGGDNSSGVCHWDPITLAAASAKYNVDTTKDIDAWIVYSKSYGTTYNGVIKSGSTQNPIDGQTYTSGDTLPAWKTFASKLGIANIKQSWSYGENDGDNFKSFKGAKSSTEDGAYIDKNNQKTDLFYNTTANLNSLGDEDQLVDLTSYINNGSMPAFQKFLDDNPEVKTEITHNGKIFYTPYLDGYQAIERNYVMDTTQVEKLLDNDLPAGTGLLAAGKDGAAKGLKSTPKAQSYLGAEGKNYDKDLEITIVNPKTNAKISVKVYQTDNIIAQQNKLLEEGTTGKALIDQFKEYVKVAYKDILPYYDNKISKMFTSVGACYNADDLVALLRIFKANPDVLYGSADVYDEVVPVFPRGQADNRVENILNFGATLYGVQGRGSEYDHLFFGADGKIHDFDTQQASYDMLDKLHALYSEKLIQQNFWNGDSGTFGLDTYFKKSKNGTSTYGLMEYDYIATQSAANDKYKGVGTASSSRKLAACGYDFSNEEIQGVVAILSPLTYVSTQSYTWDQALDNKTGKTLTRYYEENRSVKNTSWAIPAGSDNIPAAITLMDYMFSEEGWRIQNFGPEGYWELDTVLGEENTPVIKQQVLEHFAETNLDFWNYCRGFLGTTHGIGHYRPTTLDMQATNFYTQESYTNLALACQQEVQISSKAKVSDFDWKTSMPMAVFSTLDTSVANTYAGVTNFWNQGNKTNTTGTMVGWVAIVAAGSDYSSDVLTGINGNNYTYTQVKAQIATKNAAYLYAMGEKMNLIAPEARRA